MIIKYNEYIKESFEDGYQETLDIINKLVENGDIILNKPIEDIVDSIVGKDKKYPQFGFESFFISMANGKGFISEADKDRMGDYIKRIKEMDIDVSKLEELYQSFKKYRLISNEEDKLRHNYELGEEEKDGEFDRLANELDSLEPKISEFNKELENISKKVVEKL